MVFHFGTGFQVGFSYSHKQRVALVLYVRNIQLGPLLKIIRRSVWETCSAVTEALSPILQCYAEQLSVHKCEALSTRFSALVLDLAPFTKQLMGKIMFVSEAPIFQFPLLSCSLSQ